MKYSSMSMLVAVTAGLWALDFWISFFHPPILDFYEKPVFGLTVGFTAVVLCRLHLERRGRL